MDQFEAARTGNLEWFKEQKEAGLLPDLMVQDFDTEGSRWYPHEYAIYADHAEVLIWIVEHSGQDIDISLEENWALFAVARYDCMDVLQVLLKHYNKLFDISIEDYQVLNLAQRYKHLDIAKWILNESWKYGQSVVPLSTALKTIALFDTTLEECCSEYLSLQTVLALGYTLKEAAEQVQKLSEVKSSTKTKRI